MQLRHVLSRYTVCRFFESSFVMKIFKGSPQLSEGRKFGNGTDNFFPLLPFLFFFFILFLPGKLFQCCAGLLSSLLITKCFPCFSYLRSRFFFPYFSFVSFVIVSEYHMHAIRHLSFPTPIHSRKGRMKRAKDNLGKQTRHSTEGMQTKKRRRGRWKVEKMNMNDGRREGENGGVINSSIHQLISSVSVQVL